MSKGEDYIVSLLRAAHVKFEREKTYPDLHGKRNVPLRFDFYLPDYHMVIEYQGKQHFEPVAYFGGEESFKQCCQRDIDKKMLSDKYGVGLVYINYNEEITEQLIKERVVEALKQLA